MQTYPIKTYFPSAKKSGLLATLLLLLVLQSRAGLAYDEHKLYFASDSGSTYCKDSNSSPDRSKLSTFNRLRQSPPPGFTIEPDVDIPAAGPCSDSNPDQCGYGGLKILDWYTPVTDASGSGVCAWSCSDCPDNYTVHNSGMPTGGSSDWCCCGSRRSCLDQTDAAYIVLELSGNDLWQLYRFYDKDVDLVVEQAKQMTTYLLGAGRKVIWISYAPTSYGSFGMGEIPCTDWTTCLTAMNSNDEYFLSKFRPWLAQQDNAFLIDFFGHVRSTYGSNFSLQYSYDGVHLKPEGHEIFYSFVYDCLESILGIAVSTTTTISVPVPAQTTTSTSTITTTTITTTTTAPACTPALAPAESKFPGLGGAGRLTISAESTCVWSAVCSADWITILSDPSGTGPAVLRYRVMPNMTGQERTGAITAQGKGCTIHQSKARFPFNILLYLLGLFFNAASAE